MAPSRSMTAICVMSIAMMHLCAVRMPRGLDPAEFAGAAVASSAAPCAGVQRDPFIGMLER